MCPFYNQGLNVARDLMQNVPLTGACSRQDKNIIEFQRNAIEVLTQRVNSSASWSLKQRQANVLKNKQIRHYYSATHTHTHTKIKACKAFTHNKFVQSYLQQ